MSVNIFENGKLRKIAGNAKEFDAADVPAQTTATESDFALSDISGETSKISFASIVSKIALSALKTADKTITGAINALAKPTKGIAHANGDASCVWAKFLTIDFHTDYYVDSPIEIVVGQRAKTQLNTLELLFNSGNLVGINHFYYSGYPTSTFRAVVNDDNTCDIYAKLTNVYDQVAVYDIKYNDNLLDHVDFVFPNEFVSEPPDSAVAATYRVIASHDTSGRNIAEAFTSGRVIVGSGVEFLYNGVAVTILIRGRNVNSSTGWTKMVDIPQQFAPKYEVLTVGYNNLQNTYDKNSVLDIRVSVNGEVYIYIFQDIANKNIPVCATITYVR